MKTILENVFGFIFGLFILWLFAMSLVWLWDHKGGIFTLMLWFGALVLGASIIIGIFVKKEANPSDNINETEVAKDEKLIAPTISSNDPVIAGSTILSPSSIDKNSNTADETNEQPKNSKDDEDISIIASSNKDLNLVNKMNEQVLSPELSTYEEGSNMNELTYMLQIIKPEYVKETLLKIYTDVENQVGRHINQNEKSLIAAAITIALTQAQKSSSFRTKKSKSLARASSLAVMRSLAFNIDAEASTGLFREYLMISQTSLDKEIINTIDNNLNDSNYSRSTSRIVLLATTEFLNKIGFDIWKNKIDIDIFETNVDTLFKNVWKTIVGDGTSEEQFLLYKMGVDLCKAYAIYNEETDDLSALYYIS